MAAKMIEKFRKAEKVEAKLKSRSMCAKDEKLEYVCKVEKLGAFVYVAIPSF